MEHLTFHYRNLGSAFGKVLVGIEDNSANNKKLLKHLHKTIITSQKKQITLPISNI